MQTLNVSVKIDADSLLVTIVCVTRAAVHFRRFRQPCGTTLADITREAERMTLERWPGATCYRLPLPMEDCGSMHPGPDDCGREDVGAFEG